MASRCCCTVKVLEHSQVSPPPGSVPNTSLPLSFFDFLWLFANPLQRLFFYELPFSTLHFTQSILPSLRSSLSLTLKTFFPFAANLVSPPSPHKPHILYTDGDSIPFIVAESRADFDGTISCHARDVRDLHPFVPELPHARVVSGNRVQPLLALQVTVFPNSGISIGVTFSHVVADGRSFNHFMKTWASVLRSAGNSAPPAMAMPFLERSAVQEKDPCGIESVFLNAWWSRASNREDDNDKEQVHRDVFADKVRATFVIGRDDIERLKRYVLNRWIEKCGAEQPRPRTSTFAVACALAWTCLIKARQHHRDDEFYYFGFVADCRNRPELAIPETYFGNCLAICLVRMMGSELLGENGVPAATKAIGNRVEEFENGALREAETWINGWTGKLDTARVLTVAGSPKLRVYDTDFGWGRPKKTEVVHIDASSTIYLGDSRDEEGGIEIGLALKRDEMEAFTGFFEHGLKAI